MALHLLSLWGLMLCVHGTVSSCNLTCYTDYEVLVNCSCSGAVHTHPVLLNFSCTDDGDEVTASCQITPPHTWCSMYPEQLYLVASVGNNCTTSVSEPDDRGTMAASETLIWAISDAVKAPPPFNIQVTDTGDAYNISWSSNFSYPLTYRVRVRANHSVLKAQSVNEKQFVMEHGELPPRSAFTVDVQAGARRPYDGPWSEWSSAAEWRAPRDPDMDGFTLNWWIIFLPVVLVVLFLLTPLVLQLLGYMPPPRWSKTLAAAWRKYTPTPDDFFTPLYQNHGGNFKEWAKPFFGEYDYMWISSAGPTASEKQHDVLHWNNEKKRYGEEADGGAPQPAGDDAPLMNYQDGSSSQGTGRSMGHVSIHTVTLSGEELEDEVTSQSSIRSYQDGESFGSLEAGLDGDGDGELQHQNQISLENLNFLDEPEQLFLNSFVSNEQSEDGYPHVDLDTIDSGFGECSSPAALNTEQHTELFTQQHKNSNYVKQWMVCRSTEEDGGGGGGTEPQEQSC